ncbi:MAG: hypothetical protein FJX76_10620 [Armatimonadetes bacterium]|nr:hypothetical protein [Armatimonadota bacterium]
MAVSGAYSINPEFSDHLNSLAGNSQHRACASRLAAGQQVSVDAADHTMAPVIWPRDKMVFGFPDVNAIEPGEIVLFRHDDRLVARRVVRKEIRAREDVFVTRCESGERQDVTVDATQVLGRLLFLERGPLRIPASELLPGWVTRLTTGVTERLGRWFRGA